MGNKKQLEEIMKGIMMLAENQKVIAQGVKTLLEKEGVYESMTINIADFR